MDSRKVMKRVLALALFEVAAGALLAPAARTPAVAAARRAPTINMQTGLATAPAGAVKNDNEDPKEQVARAFELAKLKRDQLVDMCKASGLPTSGTKADLAMALVLLKGSVTPTTQIQTPAAPVGSITRCIDDDSCENIASMPLTADDVKKAQEGWANAIQSISKTYLTG